MATAASVRIASPSHSRRQVSRWLSTAALVAVACFLAGIALLAEHCLDGQPSTYRAASGMVLVVLAACQLAAVYQHWRWSPAACRLTSIRSAIGSDRFGGRAAFHSHNAWTRSATGFGRRLFMGAVFSYICCLALGPNSDVRYLFLALLVACYTLALAITMREHGRASSGDRAADRAEQLLARRLGKALLAGLLTVAAAEALLRSFDVVAGRSSSADFAARSLKLQPGTVLAGLSVNELGYWDEPFQQVPAPGTFRIAAVGGGVTLSGTPGNNYLAHIERCMPGVEVCNFGLTDAGPRELAAQVAGEIVHYHPDLVLAFFSVGDDVIGSLPMLGAFDWRSLRLAQLAVPGLQACRPTGQTCHEAGTAVDYESFLRATARRLAVCRTPIDDRIEHRWYQALSDMRNLVQNCQSQDIAVAVVLVPSEYQVDPQLCKTLCRRAGYEATKIDLDLPQRRLARFGDENRLPVLDLLPSLRSATQPVYLRNSTHWSDSGHQLAGETIGGWLQARYGRQIAGRAK